jgi:hypothetical protein
LVTFDQTQSSKEDLTKMTAILIRSKSKKSFIDHLKELCSFPNDSTMEKYMDQQGWSVLEDVTMVALDEVKDFATFKDDGAFEAKPMMHHLRMITGFLLFYNRMSRELSSLLDEDDVMAIPITCFQEYCGSPDYHADLEAGLAPKRFASSVVDSAMTPQEFRRSVKRDKTHRTSLKDNKHFNSWNRGIFATAFMHHTHLVLDENYIPTTEKNTAIFREIQTFMYAVLEEHLKTDKGKSLVSQFESDRDAQSIYRKLKKHAKRSTVAQISADSLLQYITTARFPGNWRGMSYSFVLHWKEQVAQYEKL